MITKEKKDELKKKLEAVSLPHRMKKIFECKYGLNDGVYKSNPTVGKRFKITGEAVRQTINKAHKLLEG